MALSVMALSKHYGPGVFYQGGRCECKTMQFLAGFRPAAVRWAVSVQQSANGLMIPTVTIGFPSTIILTDVV